MTSTTSRPFGITIIVILRVLAAMTAAAGGFVLAIVGGLIRRPILGSLVEIIAVILEVLAMISLIVSFGLWTGKHWAWITALVFAGISVLMALTGVVTGHLGRLISLILEITVICYLNTPHVKAFFGRK